MNHLSTIEAEHWLRLDPQYVTGRAILARLHVPKGVAISCRRVKTIGTRAISIVRCRFCAHSYAVGRRDWTLRNFHGAVGLSHGPFLLSVQRI